MIISPRNVCVGRRNAECLVHFCGCFSIVGREDRTRDRRRGGEKPSFGTRSERISISDSGRRRECSINQWRWSSDTGGRCDWNLECESSSILSRVMSLIRSRSGSSLSAICVWKITIICNRNSVSILRRCWPSRSSIPFRSSNWSFSISWISTHRVTKIFAISIFSAHGNSPCSRRWTMSSRTLTIVLSVCSFWLLSIEGEVRSRDSFSLICRNTAFLNTSVCSMPWELVYSWKEWWADGKEKEIDPLFIVVLLVSYHICPSRQNFQFDASFMFIIAVLNIIKIYQTRHPDINPRSSGSFSFLAFIILVTVVGVVGEEHRPRTFSYRSSLSLVLRWTMVLDHVCGHSYLSLSGFHREDLLHGSIESDLSCSYPSVSLAEIERLLLSTSVPQSHVDSYSCQLSEHRLCSVRGDRPAWIVSQSSSVRLSRQSGDLPAVLYSDESGPPGTFHALRHRLSSSGDRLLGVVVVFLLSRSEELWSSTGHLANAQSLVHSLEHLRCSRHLASSLFVQFVLFLSHPLDTGRWHSKEASQRTRGLLKKANLSLRAPFSDMLLLLLLVVGVQSGRTDWAYPEIDKNLISCEPNIYEKLTLCSHFTDCQWDPLLSLVSLFILFFSALAACFDSLHCPLNVKSSGSLIYNLLRLLGVHFCSIVDEHQPCSNEQRLIIFQRLLSFWTRNRNQDYCKSVLNTKIVSFQYSFLFRTISTWTNEVKNEIQEYCPMNVSQVNDFLENDSCASQLNNSDRSFS